MIRIEIYIWPFGFENKKKLLHVMNIANDGTGSKESGNYKFTAFRKGTKSSIWREGKIEKFPRLRLNSWHLLARILPKMLGLEKDDEKLE